MKLYRQAEQVLGCPCSDKQVHRRTASQWKRGQSRLSLSLSGASFSLAVARVRSLPGPQYHAVSQAEKLLLAHIQGPTGPLHRRATRDMEFGSIVNSSKVQTCSFWLCLQEKSSMQHRTKQHKEVPGPSANKTKWVGLCMCLCVYAMRVFLFVLCMLVRAFEFSLCWKRARSL